MSSHRVNSIQHGKMKNIMDKWIINLKTNWTVCVVAVLFKYPHMALVTNDHKPLSWWKNPCTSPGCHGDIFWEFVFLDTYDLYPSWHILRDQSFLKPLVPTMINLFRSTHTYLKIFLSDVIIYKESCSVKFTNSEH